VVLTINGEKREIDGVSTVSELLEHFQIGHKIVVVELNREIIDKSLHDGTALNDGDSLEIVHFVGGG